jgi:opacity protein-like surface antigen
MNETKDMKNMKKIALIALLMVCFVGITTSYSHAEGGGFVLILKADYMIPADQYYKDAYGSSLLLPGIRMELDLGKKNDLFAWGQVSYAKKSGTSIGELALDIESTQIYGSAGVGYRVKAFGDSKLDLRAGLVYASYKEDAFDEEKTGNTVGLEVGVGYKFYLSSTIFTDFAVSYITAQKKEDDITVKLGGLKTGLGIGFRF